MEIFFHTDFGDFEWDSEKDAINRRKHGINFKDVIAIFQDDNRLEIYDDDCVDEDRFRVIGRINGIIVLIYTDRKDAIRIISARRATKKEERIYYEQY